MKYFERLGRRAQRSRAFHTAVSTTFSIEFAAYEQIMLPQLMASGASNCLVIADPRMASMSLSDGSRLPEQLGRDYELFSPPVASGLFHTKIVIQIGRQAGRLFVGSANITAAGLAGNAEVVVELECQDTPSPEREIVRSAWSYVSSLVPADRAPAREALNWAMDRAPWLAGAAATPLQHLEDGTAIAFLARYSGESIGSRFIGFVGDEVIERLVVSSPYWDGSLSAIGALIERFQPAQVTVLLDAEGHEFPMDQPRSGLIEFLPYPDDLKGRFKHAKFVVASSATHDHLLVGSANCTTAALGRGAEPGMNAEACIYRMLPRERAVQVLNLAKCLEEPPIDLSTAKQRKPTPPIPLAEIEARQPGTFELDGYTLLWARPDGIGGTGAVLLLDMRGSQIGSVAFEMSGEAVHRRSFRLNIEEPERVSFAIVEQNGVLSNRAHVAHASRLRKQRREMATGAVAKAINAFNLGDDFESWMHGAFEELLRADYSDRPLPAKATPKAQPSGSDGGKRGDASVHYLSYDEFMETRSPDTRNSGREESTLAGSHTDSIRSFLNSLIGISPNSLGNGDDDDESGDDDDRNDEDDQQSDEPEPPPSKPLPVPDEPKKVVVIDAKEISKSVDKYVDKLMSGAEPIGSGEVLRIRYWMMFLLFKARHPGLPDGLEASSERKGWPRMALRVIAAFFSGKSPPITRLMVAKEYTEMPVDFLECWTTVLWTLDVIEASLGSAPRHRVFLGYVQKARGEVVKILGLSPSELATGTVLNLRASLDQTLGGRLGLGARAAA
ncbi:hypothetical protein [Bosea sp. NPDC055594]